MTFLFISLMQEKRNQRVHYLQGPLNVVDSCHDSAKQASLMALAAPRVHRGMQPLRLSLLHSCVPLVASDQRSSEGKLGPSKVPLVFIDYAGRWSII